MLEITRSNLTAKWQMWKMFYSHHHDDLDHAEKYYITEYLRDIGMALNLKEEQLSFLSDQPIMNDIQLPLFSKIPSDFLEKP